MREFIIYVLVEPTTDDFWIEADDRFNIEAEDVREAIIEALESMEDVHSIEVSKTARKQAKPMFIDTEDGAIQTGYVIKGSVEVDFGDGSSYGDWRRKYVDLWLEIKEIAPKLQLEEKINLN